MLPKRQRLLLIILVIGLLGITGAFILIKNYAFSRLQTRSTTQTFSKADEVADTPVSWKSYLALGKNFEKLEQNFTAGSPEPSPLSDGQLGDNSALASYNLDLEAINSQTSQIERILKEEVDFKLLMLNNNIKAYENNLSADKERQLKGKASVLNRSFDLLVKNKEKEIAVLNESFEQELRAKYKDVLCNLQLQLSVVELMEDKKELDQKKQQLQAEIDRIHQEITEKLKSKQQELGIELATFKTARLNEKDSEFNKFKMELETNFNNDLSRYKQKLGEEFQTWHLNREREVAIALELRQEQQQSDQNQKNSNQTGEK